MIKKDPSNWKGLRHRHKILMKCHVMCYNEKDWKKRFTAK